VGHPQVKFMSPNSLGGSDNSIFLSSTVVPPHTEPHVTDDVSVDNTVTLMYYNNMQMLSFVHVAFVSGVTQGLAGFHKTEPL